MLLDTKHQAVAMETDVPRLPVQAPPPAVDPVSGLWTLSEHDVECVAIGAGILGCGGGGNPYLGKMWTVGKLKEGKRIRVITPERLARRGIVG